MGNKKSRDGKMIEFIKKGSPYWPGIVIETGDKNFILCVCHHHANRSFHLFGIGNYLCARCLGILFGGIFGFLSIIIGLFLNSLILLTFLIPLIFDGIYQMFGEYESTNNRRLISGFLFGYSILVLSYIFTIFFISH